MSGVSTSMFGCAFASATAWTNEPAPFAFVFVTVNVSAEADRSEEMMRRATKRFVFMVVLELSGER